MQATVKGNPSHYHDQADRKGAALIALMLLAIGVLVALARAADLID